MQPPSIGGRQLQRATVRAGRPFWKRLSVALAGRPKAGGAAAARSPDTSRASDRSFSGTATRPRARGLANPRSRACPRSTRDHVSEVTGGPVHPVCRSASCSCSRPGSAAGQLRIVRQSAQARSLAGLGRGRRSGSSTSPDTSRTSSARSRNGDTSSRAACQSTELSLSAINSRHVSEVTAGPGPPGLPQRVVQQGEVRGRPLRIGEVPGEIVEVSPLGIAAREHGVQLAGEQRRAVVVEQVEHAEPADETGLRRGSGGGWSASRSMRIAFMATPPRRATA